MREIKGEFINKLPVLLVIYRDPLVVCDDAFMQGENGLIARFQPANLQLRFDQLYVVSSEPFIDKIWYI